MMVRHVLTPVKVFGWPTSGLSVLTNAPMGLLMPVLSKSGVLVMPVTAQAASVPPSQESLHSKFADNEPRLAMPSEHPWLRLLHITA